MNYDNINRYDIECTKRGWYNGTIEWNIGMYKSKVFAG